MIQCLAIENLQLDRSILYFCHLKLLQRATERTGFKTHSRVYGDQKCSICGANVCGVVDSWALVRCFACELKMFCQTVCMGRLSYVNCLLFCIVLVATTVSLGNALDN